MTTSLNESSCDNFSNMTEKCFPNVFENTPSKILIVLLSIVMSILNIHFSLGVILYEQQISDSRKTLMNHLVSQMCYTLIRYIVLSVSVDIFRFTVGALPIFICYMHTIIKTAGRLQVLFLFDFMLITKYAFVFYFKNPSAITEDFWSLFVSIYTIFLSHLFSFGLFYMGEQQPISVYICSDMDIKHHLNFSSKSFRVLDLISFAFFIFVNVKIYFYKKQLKPESSQNGSSTTVLLVNNLSNIMNVFCLVLVNLSAKMVNSVDHITINQQPNILYMQFYLLIVPNLVVLILSIVYYVKNPKLQGFVCKFVKNIFVNLKSHFA